MIYIKYIDIPYSIEKTYRLWKHIQTTFDYHYKHFSIRKVLLNKNRYAIKIANTKYLYGIQIWFNKNYYCITKDK